MSATRPCTFCNNPIPESLSVCPHCGRPSLYRNVEVAEATSERAELDRRYQTALAESASRGGEQAVRDFEAAVADSKAVLARSPGELLRLANSDHEPYATFYELIEGGMRASAADEWEFRRRVADAALFPGYFKDIRFAALSLDGIGLSTFGSCSIVLRNNMIEHRASVLEENSVIFVERHGVAIKKDGLPHGTVPPGYRGTWADRGKLCAAKLHSSIDAGTAPAEYSGLLMRQGATSEEHEFVEAHIFGPMTVRTIEQVSVPKRGKSADNVNIKKLGEELRKFGVTVRFR